MDVLVYFGSLVCRPRDIQPICDRCQKICMARCQRLRECSQGFVVIAARHAVEIDSKERVANWDSLGNSFVFAYRVADPPIVFGAKSSVNVGRRDKVMQFHGSPFR